jgi:hypothetical protein
MVIRGKNKIKVMVSEWQKRCVVSKERGRERERVRNLCRELRRYY